MHDPQRTATSAGSTPIKFTEGDVDGSWVTVDSELFYRISNVDRMSPFFMSIVSDSDHWMFISSNGGMTAGRRNSDQALFPYTTEDKVRDNAGNTGSRMVIRVENGSGQYLWEPFNEALRGLYGTATNLYKNVVGNKLIFEEINKDLNLTVRYLWTTSEKFGFVKQTELFNAGSASLRLSVLDGIENILPWGAVDFFQTHYSCLGDAYKQNELDKESGIGIFAFTSIPGDSTEPAEALRATVCWSTCSPSSGRLLSSTQLERFRRGGTIGREDRICGRRGAYFVHNDLTLSGRERKRWSIVAEVGCGHVEIAALKHTLLSHPDTEKMICHDVDASTRNLKRIVASADGSQHTGDPLASSHHFSNVLFNVMRGGTFASGYRIPVEDLKSVVRVFNHEVFSKHRTFLDSLGDDVELDELLERVGDLGDPHLLRHVREYLPLFFSRRHGDPSRPWNRFSINVRSRDGQRTLDYEGNWRDIFQNWEALCHSFPGFIENVICKFVNTTTADGYNPYRITKRGFEWEIPNPDEPWANFGYWGDHQLVYLLKFLELSRDFHPGRLDQLLTEDTFVYAEIPYDIKPYDELLLDPRASIDYNADRERKIAAREAAVGLDGRYLVDRSGKICRANLTEKLLVPLLAKVSNFIPGAGIWMNTQRPEWNDANNALAGFGVSMVTLCYARRYVGFCLHLLGRAETDEIEMNEEVTGWFEGVLDALREHRSMLVTTSIDDADRKHLLDRLGTAAERYRFSIYEHGFGGRRSKVAVGDLLAFFELVLEYFDQTISLNRRDDGLFHSYNIMSVSPTGVSIRRLQEMLEGQVAVLSSGCLDADDCVTVLEALRNSEMYRGDQNSYTLYPTKTLPGFLEKNTIPRERAERSGLIKRLVTDNNNDLVERDVDGCLHFNSTFTNTRDVSAALDELAENGYGQLVAEDRPVVEEIFESVFCHREFTGRSGTFYGYEGLGCIYWHMVSKLLLAVAERCLTAGNDHETARARLVEIYSDIREGLGFNKSPEVYGAFPTDPYSHTPGDGGARQPGMTGQVKEEIIARWIELGLKVLDGQIRFDPVLVREQEFLSHPEEFEYLDVAGAFRTPTLEANSLAFTMCQVIFVVHRSQEWRVVVRYSDGTEQTLHQDRLDPGSSKEIFGRTGKIARVDFFLPLDRENGRDPQFRTDTDRAEDRGDGS